MKQYLYHRATGNDLEKLLREHLLLLRRCIAQNEMSYIRPETTVTEESFAIRTDMVSVEGLPPFNFPMVDGSHGLDEMELKTLVEHEFYIKELLELSLLVPKEYRTFDHSSDQIQSAICRCVERRYSVSLQALCEYAQRTGIPPTNLYLLPKYFPIDLNIYAIAASYGYHDLSYEGKEDNSVIDGTKEYVGYRLASHTFYYMQPSRVRQFLEHWLKTTYKNCTVEAVMHLQQSKNQVRTVADLLQRMLASDVTEANVTPNAFISRYWEKGYVIEDWMYITGM